MQVKLYVPKKALPYIGTRLDNNFGLEAVSNQISKDLHVDEFTVTEGKGFWKGIFEDVYIFEVYFKSEFIDKTRKMLDDYMRDFLYRSKEDAVFYSINGSGVLIEREEKKADRTLLQDKKHGPLNIWDDCTP